MLIDGAVCNIKIFEEFTAQNGLKKKFNRKFFFLGWNGFEKCKQYSARHGK